MDLVEYNDSDKLTAVVQAGVSNQAYSREDYFDQPGNPISETSNLLGGYVKGGANYNINENSNVSSQTLDLFHVNHCSTRFSQDIANNINEGLENEEIMSFELGYGYIGDDLTVEC